MSTEEEATAEIAEVAPVQWPQVVELQHPVVIGSSAPITSLTFREGELGDLRGIKIDKDGLTLDQLMSIASRMCGQPPVVINKLRGKDGARALGIARDFFTDSLTSGI